MYEKNSEIFCSKGSAVIGRKSQSFLQLSRTITQKGGKIVDSKEILSANLKNFRVKHHISQEELADQVERSTRGYAKIERGEVQPLLATLDKLACGMGLSAAELLSETFEQETIE